MEPRPKTILKELLEGNRRYAEGRMLHPRQDSKRRAELSKGQQPVAIVIGCSDSRISPEILFDAGLGDLFVIRVAGGVIDDVVLGSVEFVVEHLECRLIIFLSHKRCAAMELAVKGHSAPGHINSLVKALRPMADIGARMPGDAVDNTARESARLTVKRLKETKPILNEFSENNELMIVGAFYDLDTGLVEILK